MDGYTSKCEKKSKSLHPTVRPVYHMQNHTCQFILLQPAGWAVVVGQVSSLRPHWLQECSPLKRKKDRTKEAHHKIEHTIPPSPHDGYIALANAGIPIQCIVEILSVRRSCKMEVRLIAFFFCPSGHDIALYSEEKKVQQHSMVVFFTVIGCGRSGPETRI